MSDSPTPCQPHDASAQIPQWKLERYLLEELPAADMAAVGQVIAGSAALRQRLDALRRDDAAMLGNHPAPWMARRILARAAPPARERSPRLPASWRWRLAPAAAVALVAAVVLPSRWDGTVRPPDESPAALQASVSAIRLKGAPYLVVHRKTATGSERLASGAAARAGDLVLIQYHGAGRRYGAILSADGRGALTVHLPAAGTGAASLTDSGLVSLGYAYELDDAPRWERFYFVTADRPFDVAAVAAAVGRQGGSGALDLPGDLEQYSFELDKAVAPQVSAAAEAEGR